jgi:hypothetical protein
MEKKGSLKNPNKKETNLSKLGMDCNKHKISNYTGKPHQRHKPFIDFA